MEDTQGYNTLHTCFNSPFYLSLACSRCYFLSLSPSLRFCGPLLLCSDVTTLCLYTTASSQENHKRLGGGPQKDTAKESR